jgi:hypothetical protein
MNNLTKRVFIKLCDYCNLFAGSIFDALQRARIVSEFPVKAIIHFGPAETVVHPYPQNYQQEHQAHFVTWKEYNTLLLDLYSLENVRVTYEGVVLKNAKPFIPALPHPIFRHKFGVLYNLYSRLRYSKKSADPSKKYVLVYDFWSQKNYYHWCIDSLCRAWMVKEFLKEGYELLLPPKPASYVYDSLACFDLNDRTLVPKNTLLKIHSLSMMGYAAGSGRHHPAILNKVRDLLLEKLDIHHDPTKNNQRIYASRGRQSSRTVVNEEDLISLLERNGFRTVYFEGMSLAEQAGLMQHTSVFISSHGANMTNCLFLPDNAKVLELINDRQPNFCYWSLCAGIRLAYYYQLCAIATSDHIRVDLPELEKNLALLLDETEKSPVS